MIKWNFSGLKINPNFDFQPLDLQLARFNILVNIVTDQQLEDAHILFGDSIEDEPQTISNAMDLETLAVEVGVFKSKAEARKNGWQGPIPFGFNCLGTKKRRIWVWNPEKNTHQLDAKFFHNPRA